jgi:antitoxin HicB
MTNQYVSGDFDDFLREEGILEEVEAAAIKKVLAFKIAALMEEQKISKTEMAHRMKTSRAALERILDPDNCSITLTTMDKAAKSVGARLRLSLDVDEPFHDRL